MAELLFQFRHEGDAPSLAEVRERFGVREGEIDPGYGVVKVAEDAGGALYAVRVDETARDRLQRAIEGAGADPSVGFFSDPPIEPFGPPQP